jgi:hypothetical protein
VVERCSVRSSGVKSSGVPCHAMLERFREMSGAVTGAVTGAASWVRWWDAAGWCRAGHRTPLTTTSLLPAHHPTESLDIQPCLSSCRA